ncbi:MAG: hypothetical protein H6718_02710 [Polyangiaceae bacterium]|nr:hypothetical protein [Myxococcales bacterium]MCB9584277.1 hypothetical protein [Polyangiaceae bacterium]MCB9608560.1 hypothetical protein [Polyangiaceae bacterium]
MLSRTLIRRLGSVVASVGLLTLSAGSVQAEVEKAGSWPDSSPKVSLSLSRATRSEALHQLAEAAHWNVIYRGPEGQPIDLHVKQLSADDVMQALFADANYRAERKGDFITILPLAESPAPSAAAAIAAPSAAAAPSATQAAPEPPEVPAAAAPAEVTPPVPPIPPSVVEPPALSADTPAEAAEGKDRVITGSSIRIEKGEVVHDLTVMGGSAEVFGTVTGDLTVMGGRAVLRPGARVGGDAAVVGGNLELQDGTEVGGDVGVMGGKLSQAKGARVLGEVQTNRTSGDIHVDGEERGKTMGLIEQIGSALTKSAMLFVFGVVLMALATRRMDALSQEVTLRPMRSFALGVVAWLGALIGFIVLCVTLIGIPIALLGVLVLTFVSYAGICAVLQTLGGTLVQHRTKNPYTHLAVGCAVFLLVGAIPWLGGFFTFAVVTMGLGAAVASRKLSLRLRSADAAA